jgi:hypothetical protein
MALRQAGSERVHNVKQLVGAHYSEEANIQLVPLNLIKTYTEIVGRKLMANHPRCMLSTMLQSSQPTVNAEESWVNKQMEKIQLKNTLKRCVIDALFNIGIIKVGLATPDDAAMLNWNLQAGEPFAEVVDLDDFVYDVHARDFSQVAYIGHRYRRPLKAVRDSKLYGKQRKDLTASDDPIFNLEGDERLSILSRTYYAQGEEFEDMVDLWEFFLPRHQLIVTVMDHQLVGATTDGYDPWHGKALGIQRWLGPTSGPYHFLGFGIVPNNAMPNAPIPHLIDLHEALNRMARKLIRQCDRLKENTFVAGTAAEDGSRILKSNDGEIIKVDHPEAVNKVMMGGPDPNLFQVFTAFKELFSWLAGNLDSLGGLSPQAKTAEQDQMLSQASSATITSMQEEAVGFVRSVVSALIWYEHHHPFKTMTTQKNIPGLNRPLTRRVTPQQRQQVPWEELEIQVDPYSLQPSTPEQRAADLDQLVGQILTPLMPILQQQGVQFDVQAYLKRRSVYKNMPDAESIVTLGEPPTDQGSPSGPASPQGPAMPANTTRNYVRRSVGGATAPGQDLQALNAMRSNGQQSGSIQK